MPQLNFGVPCIYPQILGIPPYHNNAVWPFVQTYWALASSKAGNEKSVIESVAAVYRPAALFLTNKENFVAETGDFAGTQINSSNMLWSLSGNLALVHKVLFGIEFGTNSLKFNPFVPKSLNGKKSLTNFKYRNTMLTIEMEGYGSKISSFELDGKQLSKYEIPYSLFGKHSLKIKLNNQSIASAITKTDNYTTLQTPVVTLENGKLKWEKVPVACTYEVYCNGKKIAKTDKNYIDITTLKKLAEYHVSAMDKLGVESFVSEPIDVNLDNQMIDIRNFVDTSATPNYGQPATYVEISRTKNTKITIPLNINESGKYALNISYTNGNGPVNTENKCAIRSVYVDNLIAGTFVFPQRGKGEWSNIGFSNTIITYFKKGKHRIAISFDPENENMNGEINQAFLGNLHFKKLE